MTLKSELIEAMAQGVHAGMIAPHEAQWHELTDRERDCCRFDAQAALSAHSTFLTERGLKVVGREATEGMANVGAYSGPAQECWCDMWEAAPDLFAEAEDAEG